ncbi:MAG: hypothetical protein Q7U88_16120 [Desulfocapsaceae bacterium]|nr:hypothetical protein [Desulfocapsaceae bacterium]
MMRTPRDIYRALAHADYSADPQKRALQYEAVAHIEVQRLIDNGEIYRLRRQLLTTLPGCSGSFAVIARRAALGAIPGYKRTSACDSW